MIWGSREFPGASYDNWKTTPPDYYYEDPDYGDDYDEAFCELESIDDLAVFFDTHEQVSN
jgi:hypothetical protein